MACHILCKELVRLGHEVDYVTSSFGDFKKIEVIDGITIYRVPVFGRKDLNNATFQSLLWYPITSLIKGYGLCRKKEYDIINVQFVVPSGLSGYVLARWFGIPLITSLHGGDIYDPTKKLSPHRNGFFQRIVARLLRNSDRVIAQSSNTQKNALSLYKFNDEVTIIPLGFNPPEVSMIKREALGLSEEDIVIVSVGRVVKRKGYDEALSAVRALKHKPNWKYIIIGDGPLKVHLESLCRKSGIEDRVIFTGFVSEELKFQYLMNADIYFLSSHHEGFGICLQEAMFSGMSIVSTDQGGQMDFLEDEKNALIVPVCNVKEMTRALIRLVEDKDLRTRIALNNREKVKEFSANNVAQMHITVFEEILNK